ncbi:MAG TPA: TlpA disulfide reductase family protein, partial [Candidatus Polarisedimenticolia bacterium]|nr:TlpA disulfide reductase family protein [Candidatus Polarisedimenticolia bacterium]
VERVDPPASPGAVTPHLAASGDGVWMTWFEPASPGAGAGEVAMARLSPRAGGWGWSEPRPVARGERFFANWADFPSVHPGPGGVLLAHWLEMMGEGAYAYGVSLARSADGGATWIPLGRAHDDSSPTEHGFASMVAEAGGFRVFWLDGRGMAGGGHGAEGDMTLMTAAVGESVGSGEVIDARVCDCCQTGAAVTGEGPVVVYRDRSGQEVRDIAIVRRTRTGWSAPAPVHQDGWVVPGCPVNGPAVAAAPDGRTLVVAWFTAPSNEPRVLAAFSHDGGAAFDPPVVVDDREPVGRVSVAMDGRGGAVVGWVGGGEGDEAELLLRRVRPGGAAPAGPPFAVARVARARAGGFPRLARAEDRLVAAWTEAGRPGGVRAAVIPMDLLPGGEDPEAEPGASVEARRPRDARPWDRQPGSMAPDYAARTLEGEPARLAPARSRKPTLVNVWATWCVPCREELPLLADLHHRFSPRGLEVVGISVDDALSAGDVRSLAGRERIPYTILLDPDDRASSVFGLSMLPGSFLFDAQGILVWRRDGVIHRDDPELERALHEALR